MQSFRSVGSPEVRLEEHPPEETAAVDPETLAIRLSGSPGTVADTDDTSKSPPYVDVADDGVVLDAAGVVLSAT